MQEEEQTVANDEKFEDINTLKEMKEIKDEDDYIDIDYKEKYRNLKRKLKSLLYNKFVLLKLQEQECFHEELRKAQRKCLRVSRDKSFLLDRLLQYEQPDVSSDEELTESSSEDDTNDNVSHNKKKDSSKIKFPDAKKSKTQLSTKANDNSTAERIRCKHLEKGKQCTKLVSKKIKSGICQTHRQLINKQEKEATETKDASPAKQTSPLPSPRQPPTGGKDIGHIREALQESSRIAESSPENEDEDDDLVIDLPH